MLAAIAAWNSVSSTRRYPKSQRRNLNISTLFDHERCRVSALAGWDRLVGAAASMGRLGYCCISKALSHFPPPAVATPRHAEGGCQFLLPLLDIHEPLGIRRCLGVLLFGRCGGPLSVLQCPKRPSRPEQGADWHARRQRRHTDRGIVLEPTRFVRSNVPTGQKVTHVEVLL